MAQFGPMNALARKYQDKAEFLYVYGRESHLEKFADLLVEAKAALPGKAPKLGMSANWEDCAERARFFKKHWGITRRVLVDLYGPENVLIRFNRASEHPAVEATIVFVVDRQGRLVFRREMEPGAVEALDEFLQGHLGKGG
jgi:hypothetical protein